MYKLKKMKKYTPLIIWLSIIISTTYIYSQVLHDYEIFEMMTMNIFMAMRFGCFGIIKLINLNQFAKWFAKYDLLANYIPVYGYIFPIIEILLGFAYIIDTNMNYYVPINIIAIIITWLTSLWIMIKLTEKKDDLACMCMWSKFTTPLGLVSLFEQLAMLVMAIWMLRYMHSINIWWSMMMQGMNM